MDLNRDGRLGGTGQAGITGHIEKATNVDINQDGVIGGGHKTTSAGHGL
jgi:hypothetical protein